MFLSLKLVFVKICITDPLTDSFLNFFFFIDLALNNRSYCTSHEEIIEEAVNLTGIRVTSHVSSVCVMLSSL